MTKPDYSHWLTGLTASERAEGLFALQHALKQERRRYDRQFRARLGATFDIWTLGGRKRDARAALRAELAAVDMATARADAQRDAKLAASLDRAIARARDRRRKPIHRM